MFLSLGIRYVGISLACTKSFLEVLAESRGLLSKEHFLHLQSSLYASKLRMFIVFLEGRKGFGYYDYSLLFIIFRKRLLEFFWLLRCECCSDCQTNDISYEELKVNFVYYGFEFLIEHQ